jgi:autotransporter-associated beta strand protein
MLVELWAALAPAATTRTWTGGAFTGFWSDMNNWSPAGIPGPGDTLVFPPNSSSDNNLTGLELNSIRFTGTGGSSLTGNPLSLDSDITAGQTSESRIYFDITFPTGGTIYTTDTSGTGVMNIEDNIFIGNGQLILYTLYTNTSGTNLLIQGSIQGNADLVKLGPGDAYLVGNLNNLYTGATYARGGTLHLAKTGGAVAISSKVSVGDNIGVTSLLVDEAAGQYPLAIDMTVGSFGQWWLQNTATVTNLTIIPTDTLGYEPFYGAEIVGTGFLGLECDVLVTNKNGGNNAGMITCTLLLGNQSRTFSIGDNFDTTDDYQNYFEVHSIIGTSDAGITKNGFGAMSLVSPNDYAGPTLVQNGTLAIGDNNALGASSGPNAGTIVSYGSTLELAGVSIAEPIVLSNAYSTIAFESTNVLTGPLSLIGETRISASEPGYADGLLEIDGVVSGVGTINVFSGTVRLAGIQANTFTGGVNLWNNNVSFSAFLEVAKPNNITAVPGLIDVQNISLTSTNLAGLRSLQDNGVSDVRLGRAAAWLLSGHTAAPHSLTFCGDASVDTQGGQLQLANAPGTNSLYVTVSTNAVFSFSNFTASITGTLSCLAPTNDVVVDAGLTLGIAAQIVGPGTLRKLGPGTVDFSGVGNTAAPLLLAEGLAINDAVLGLGAQTFVSDGATVSMGPSTSLCGAHLFLSGTGIGGTNGALLCTNGCVLTNQLTLSAPATINLPDGGALATYNLVNGTGPLTKTGNGMLSMFGNAPNTYSGDTIITDGLLGLYESGAVPGNLVLGTRNGLTIGGTAATNRLFIAGGIGGTNVTVNGGSLLDLNNYNQSLVSVNLNGGGSIFTGTGTLSFIQAIGTGTRITVNPGHTGSSVVAGNVSVAFGGSFWVGAQTFVLTQPAPPLNFQATLSAGLFSILVKQGPGEMRLSAANGFNSTLYIDEGQMTAANPMALGSTAGGTVVEGSGTLVLDAGGMLINNEALALNSSNTVSLVCLSGSNTWTGPVTLSQIAGIDVEPTNGYLQVLSSVAGSGGLNKLGPGTLQFQGVNANTYTGLTTVSLGTLEAGRVSLLAIPGDVVVGDNTSSSTLANLVLDREQQLSPTANVTVNSSGYLHLYDFPSVPPPNQQLRTLTGTGQVRIDSAAHLTISNEVDFTFDGTLAGGVFFGSGNPLSKLGSGTMVFSRHGNGANFFGPMILGGGTLQVDSPFASMSVEARPGTLLRGGGSLNTVTVENGATVGVDSVVPGQQGGTLGCLSAQLTNGSTLRVNFYGPSQNGGDDRLALTSPGTVSNATLSAAFRYPAHEGDVITFWSTSFSGATKGNFAGWPEGATQTINGIPCRLTYLAGSGNNMTLTVTNLALDYFSYRLADGNGNQTVEPDECNLLYVSLLNYRANSVTITNALLRAISSNAVVTIATATYPTIPAGSAAENITPFQFRTDPALACGAAVSFELVLSVANEGQFAVTVTPVAGLDCTHPTGPCQSCTVVSGQFTPGSPLMVQPLYFVGAPSLCYPAKLCPGPDPGSNLPPVRYVTHSFTNSTTNMLCVTANLQFNCPAAPTNALGVAAYLGNFDPNQPCSGYLGDLGQGGPPYLPFSFQVPPASSFVIVVDARTTNLVCDSYAVELFGLLCPAPTLAIERAPIPGTVSLDWSSAYPGWTAQQEGRLGTSFVDIAQAPTIVAGRYSITNIRTITNEFYRLRH